MTFHIGEKVVYPNQGIGTVENISTRNFGSKPEPYYLLRMEGNQMTVIVPFSHVRDVGLRRVTTNGSVSKVLKFLESGECDNCRDWKARYKKNCEKMRTGGILEIAEVLKSLLIIQKQKPLSFREKKMLDRARHMLVMEVSIARAIRPEAAVELLNEALRKAGLELPAPL